MMKMLTRPAITGLLGLTLLAGGHRAQAQITKSGTGYLMRAKYVKGQKLTYVMTTQTLGMEGMPGMPKGGMNMGMTMTQNVTDVTKGVATINASVVTSLNGKAMATPQTITLKMDSLGRPVGGAGIGQLQGSSMALPLKPIKVGETIQQTSNVNMGGAPMTVKSTSKFLGVKNIGGKQVAQFSVNLTGTGIAKTSGSGISTFNMADGQLESMNLKQAVTVSQGTPSGKSIAMQVNVTMTRK